MRTLHMPRAGRTLIMAAVVFLAVPLLPRTAAAQAPAPAAPAQVTIDPKLFDNYVGHYEVVAGITLTISRDGSRFFARLTAQAPVEIFASGPREFFMKSPDAHVTFEVDRTGRAIAAILTQNGASRRTVRMDDDIKDVK